MKLHALLLRKKLLILGFVVMLFLFQSLSVRWHFLYLFFDVFIVFCRIQVNSLKLSQAVLLMYISRNRYIDFYFSC